jgi:hypothetical protein
VWLGPVPCTWKLCRASIFCRRGMTLAAHGLHIIWLFSSNVIRPRCACGVAWHREADSHILPLLTPASLISTRAGNDFSTLYAPLIRNGRMEQFYWKPNRQDLLAILLQMYKVHLADAHRLLMYAQALLLSPSRSW